MIIAGEIIKSTKNINFEKNNQRMVPYRDEGVIIVVSSVVSTFTYLLMNNIFSHWLHPTVLAILVISLVSLFGFVLTFFRMKKNIA